MGAQTLAQMPEEHVKEGDVDGSVGPSVVFDLAQDHLQPQHQREGVRGGERNTRGEHTQTHMEERPSSNGTSSRTLARQDQVRKGVQRTNALGFTGLSFLSQLQEHTLFPHHCSGFMFLPSCEPTSLPPPSLLTWIQPPRMLVVSFR